MLSIPAPHQLVSDHSKWTREQALYGAQLSALAYAGRDEIRTSADAQGWGAVHHRIGRGPQWSLLLHPPAHDDPGVAALAIAGSNDPRDWWQNFASILLARVRGHKLVDSADVLIGRWWARGALQIVEDVLPILRTARNQWGRSGGLWVLLYGHSLAGVVAHYLAPYLARELHVRALYTYGAPRPGDGAWAEWYRRRAEWAWWSMVTVSRDLRLDPASRVGRSRRVLQLKWPWSHPEEGSREHETRRVMIAADGKPTFGLGAWHILRAGHPVPWWRELQIVSNRLARVSGHRLATYIKRLEAEP